MAPREQCSLSVLTRYEPPGRVKLRLHQSYRLLPGCGFPQPSLPWAMAPACVVPSRALRIVALRGSDDARPHICPSLQVLIGLKTICESRPGVWRLGVRRTGFELFSALGCELQLLWVPTSVGQCLARLSTAT